MEKKVLSIHFKCVDSTNRWVKQNYKSLNYAQITRVSTEEQTKGRGRFTRKWFSPKGGNIYLTYFFVVLKNKIQSISNLAQIFSLGIAQLLDREKLKVEIKWPNDLLIKGKKFAGILCETIDLDEKWGIILGCGINVNMTTTDMIDQPATSLCIELDKNLSTRALIKNLEILFLQNLDTYMKEGFCPFHKRYEKYLAYKGKYVTIEQNAHSISGKILSVHPDGYLNLLSPSEGIKTIHSGTMNRSAISS